MFHKVPVRIRTPIKSFEHGMTRITARIEINGKNFDIWFATTGEHVNTGFDPFLAALLIPAMRVGTRLICDGPVSPGLLAAIPQIQEIIHIWNTDFRIIPIETAGTTIPTPAAGHKKTTASFFSGGVDSFYSLIKHRPHLDSLVFVHGFDIPLERTTIRTQAVEALEAISQAADLPVIQVETNLRTLSDRCARWDVDYHGSALASVAHFLSPQIQKIYIPSSGSYAELRPWGSHPLLDYRWSSESVEIEHDGCEATRFNKIKKISDSPVARKHLRVCYENWFDRYNCGECHKCLATMTGLKLIGVLDQFETFTRPLDMALVENFSCLDA